MVTAVFRVRLNNLAMEYYSYISNTNITTELFCFAELTY